MTTCEDCGFEYEEGKTCPRCGYDPAADLIGCISVEDPQVSNPLEEELSALCKKAEAGEIAKEKIQEQWKIIDNKARVGNLDARHLIGRAMLMQQKFDNAHRILARLADAGHALAQIDLAKIYAEGLGVEANIFDAIKLYRLAAQRGNPIALFKLAEMYGAQSSPLRPNPDLAHMIMSKLVAAYPNMFQRNPNCNCGCNGGKRQTNGEFAVQTAFQISKMIKYLVLAALIAFIGYVVYTEFLAR